MQEDYFLLTDSRFFRTGIAHEPVRSVRSVLHLFEKLSGQHTGSECHWAAAFGQQKCKLERWDGTAEVLVSAMVVVLSRRLIR